MSEEPNPLLRFLELVSSLKPALVLEVGTLQWVPGVSTHHMSWFPHIEKPQYTMVDIAAGADVDVVANIHALPKEWTSYFNAFVACAVFEHIQRPWVAAQEIERILTPGGICYIMTVQTFPIHGYPQDYFRFSKEALTSIFLDAGLEVIAAAYEYRCKIVAPAEAVPPTELEAWNETWPSFLCVHLVARKGETAQLLRRNSLIRSARYAQEAGRLMNELNARNATNRFEREEMSVLQDLAKIFDADDVSWIHDGLTTEKELVERGDNYMEFLFSPFPDLKLGSGFRALEIGSGLGYIMEALERYVRIQGLQVGRIIGLDIAANMLEKAKARLSGRPFEFLHYDGVHIPLEDGSLDFVYSVASLQHIPKPFVYNLFFEIKRLLSPKGFSLLQLLGFSHIPHCITPWAEIVRLEVEEGERSGWVYFYSAEELRWVLGDGTGFKDVRVVEVGEALAVALSNVPSAPS